MATPPFEAIAVPQQRVSQEILRHRLAVAGRCAAVMAVSCATVFPGPDVAAATESNRLEAVPLEGLVFGPVALPTPYELIITIPAPVETTPTLPPTTTTVATTTTSAPPTTVPRVSVPKPETKQSDPVPNSPEERVSKEEKLALMAAVGIAESDFKYVNHILTEESEWCHTIWQGQEDCPPTYEETDKHSPTRNTGFGLCQSTPGIKMASAGEDWQTNPVTQLEWCNSYALQRYKSWEAAYTFWVENTHW